jgi:chemotaxis protein MotB
VIVRPFQRHEEKGAPVWLVTFADLVALLLAFFVMLFATIEVELDRWTVMVRSLSQTFAPSQQSKFRKPDAEKNVEIVRQTNAVDTTYLSALLRERTQKHPDLRFVIVQKLDDRLIIALPSDVLFDPGSAVPVAGATKSLYALAGLLSKVDNQVDVIGHTDPRPVSSGGVKNNWTLSIARAAAVSNALRQAGYSRPMRTLGYSDRRFDDLSPEIGLVQRYALARRVDIVVHANKGPEE